MLTCIFHGQCADLTIADYKRVKSEGPILAVVQHAQLSKEGIEI